MLRPTAFAVIAACMLLSGCLTPNQVAEPTDITVRAAILETAEALYAAQQLGANKPKLGLIVDEATVVFNVAAKATNKANIGTEAAGLPVDAGTLKLSIANEAYSEGTRGNTITVKFKNLATASINKDGLDFLKHCGQNPNAPACQIQLLSKPIDPGSLEILKKLQE